jgi:hypothetical protein
MILWLDEVFDEIGNVPGSFYEVNKSYLGLRIHGNGTNTSWHGPERGIARVYGYMERH